MRKSQNLLASLVLVCSFVCLGFSSVALAQDWRTELGVFRIGIVGGNDLREASARAEPFRLALEEGLSMPVEVFATRDYPALIDAAARSRIEYAVFSPLALAAVEKSCDCFEPLVSVRSGDGTDAYRMILIAPVNGAQNPAGLKGAAIGAIRSSGAGGLQLSLLELAEGGLDLKQAPNRLALFDNGVEIMEAMRKGEIAAMIGWSTLSGDPAEGYSKGTLQQMAAAGDDVTAYRSVWQSTPIPYRVHAVRNNLDAEAKTTLRTILPEMFAGDPVAYDSIEPVYGGGFVAARPSQFTELQKLLPVDEQGSIGDK